VGELRLSDRQQTLWSLPQFNLHAIGKIAYQVNEYQPQS
jgi:hypothetical protein